MTFTAADFRPFYVSERFLAGSSYFDTALAEFEEAALNVSIEDKVGAGVGAHNARHGACLTQIC